MTADLHDPFTDRLRAELAASVEPVVASARTAADALVGGRSRRRRHRARSIALVAAAVLAAGVGGPLAARSLRSPTPVPPASGQGVLVPDRYATLLDRPARGDLQGDRGYLDRVLAAWKDRTADRYPQPGTMRGEPVVVWAGSTPAGPAAVVAQKADIPPGPDINDEDTGPTTCLGFVGVDGVGKPRLVSTDCWRDHDYQYGWSRGAWFVDPGQRVLAVLDPGAPTGYTTRWEYAADGTRSQPFIPLRFVDGAASVRLPEGVNPAVVKVSTLPLPADHSGILGTGFLHPARPDGCADCPSDPLPWVRGDGNLTLDPIAGTARTGLSNPGAAFHLAVEARLTGPALSHGAPEGWLATGRLPDGTEVVVGTTRVDIVEPAHSYAVLVRPRTEVGAGPRAEPAARVRELTRVVHGGAVDAGSALPITVRLPDGAGWVVARGGAALAWRTAPDAAWTEAGKDAALVPDAATQVRVTRPAQDPVEVTLPRR